MSDLPLDNQVIADLKGLVMDATRKANSGHPGGAMSSADFAVILYKDYLKYAPEHPDWFDRDRFVLSAGHESMLLYSLLHLMGSLDMQELINFRQLGSLTPGHPESHLTKGVEATTGPLGQGISMAVGMAIAEAHLGARVGKDLCDHKTYVLVGDGDMQEPVAIGSCALAGHLALDQLIVYYDKNDIQISGATNRVDSTDFRTLMESMGWEVLEIDGHNHQAIREALDHAQEKRTKPLFIIGNTIIAKGTNSMEGSHKTHGEPLKPEEIYATKEKLGLNPEKSFFVREDSYAHFTKRLQGFNEKALAYQARLAEKKEDNSFAELWSGLMRPEGLLLKGYPEISDDSLATRKAFGKVLSYWAEAIPGIMGGSADLEPSNNTGVLNEKKGEFSVDNREGQNLAFGVREFPMTAITNGMALHGGIFPFNATFLTFSDYSRNAIRMSAIQRLQVLHVFTHDSIFLGEDGPTHQPVEHLMSLRNIPDLLVLRPADSQETIESMKVALSESQRPSLLALTRQNLNNLERAPYESAKGNVRQGAYLKYQTNVNGSPDVVIYASGSEVSLAIEAAAILEEEDLIVAVVSVPCFKLFFEQNEVYRASILMPEVPQRVSIEAGSTLGWERFTGMNGLNIGVDRFGESAPYRDLANHFGFTAEKVVARIKEHFGLKNAVRL